MHNLALTGSREKKKFAVAANETGAVVLKLHDNATVCKVGSCFTTTITKHTAVDIIIINILLYHLKQMHIVYVMMIMM